MNKINIIIKREYITRVKKKSFLIMTFLTPVLMALLIFFPVWISQTDIQESKVLAVIDEGSNFTGAFHSTESLDFDYLAEKPDSLQTFFKNNSYYAIIVIPKNFREDSIFIFSEKAISVDVKETIRYFINSNVELQNLLANNIDPQVIADAKEKIPLQTLLWSKSGKIEHSISEVNMVLGIASAFIIYMFIFIYGAQLMRGSMEDKSSRVVEILVSSAKPFEMMLGKIVGIAMVALTQFGLWVLALIILLLATKGTIIDSVGPQFEAIINALQNVDSFMWIVLFLFYFIGGYLLYGSLFAAVGAAVDSETDTQQFMLPITIPLILAFVFAQSIITNPDGQLAMWFSIIPFTSPLVMMVRLGFGVPFWQIAISMILLIATFLFTTYIASKIYRIGILSYGKKVSYKEMWKWIRYKN